MHIHVKKKPRFGIDYYEPACLKAIALLVFANRKLFKEDEFAILKDAGIDVIVVD